MEPEIMILQCQHGLVEKLALDNLSATVASDGISLHSLKLVLQLLDLGMGLLEILIETITLSNELLFPLSEALLLDLDLLSESLSQSLLLFLELGVVELPGSSLAEFASLHLLCSVGLIVKLLSGVDKVEHVGADQDRSQLLEVAVVLVLDLSNTPRVLTALDDAAIASLDVLLRADNGKRHSGHKATRVLGSSLVILLDRGLVDLDVLGLDNAHNLEYVRNLCVESSWLLIFIHTLCLNLARSAGLRVSALAITGIRLTREQRRFITSISRGFRVWPVGRMKYRQA